MTKKENFEKMYELYSAILDIDKIMSMTDNELNGESRLEKILFYTRNIPRTDYNTVYADNIIKNIRSAIVEMYNNAFDEINKDIITKTGKISNFGYTVQKSDSLTPDNDLSNL